MTTANEFWTWFAANEARFRNLAGPEAETEALLDEILDHLHEFSDGLYFEIGGPADGPLELIITAEGDADFFPQVRDLVAQAPPIPGWKVIAFRPAMGFEYVIDCSGLEISPQDCWFEPMASAEAPEQFGMRVVGPGYTEESQEDFAAAICQIIEVGLGEIAAADEIHYLEFGPLPADPEAEGYLELPALAAYLEWRKTNGG